MVLHPLTFSSFFFQLRLCNFVVWFTKISSFLKLKFVCCQGSVIKWSETMATQKCFNLVLRNELVFADLGWALWCGNFLQRSWPYNLSNMRETHSIHKKSNPCNSQVISPHSVCQKLKLKLENPNALKWYPAEKLRCFVFIAFTNVHSLF